MAGRRNQNMDVAKSNISPSLLVYLSMTAVVLVLALGIYTFGIDFGFISFGGTPNVNILYGGAALSIVFAYVADVMFIKTLLKFYDNKPKVTPYIPHFNYISVFQSWAVKVTYVLIAAALLIVVPAYTPLGRFLPSEYLYSIQPMSITVLLGILVVYNFIRGFQCVGFKKTADEMYSEHISEDYGNGGKMTLVNYVLYFLPIIRSVAIFTDVNYVNTLWMEMEEMKRREQR